jgi:hypothetical protein
MAYPVHVLRGRAAIIVALGVTGLVAGCSYDRRETLAEAPAQVATTTTVVAPSTAPRTPLACGAVCPRFYGGRPPLDPARFDAACLAAHDQFWSQIVGNPDAASVEQFAVTLTSVGATPDVVDAARRWAQVRVDNVARDRAVTARGAGVDLSTDPDYRVMYEAFTAPPMEADTAQVIGALNGLCAPTPLMPGTR